VAPPSPTGRSLAGIALIILLIAVWAGLIASLSPIVSQWPILIQTVFYVVVGTVWIIPLKPLVVWMVTGRFRAPDLTPPD
jgi:hypothetical protein